MRSLLRGSISLALLFCAVIPASAQEFRVYTKIYDVRNESGSRSKKSSTPVSRTTTVFHAGKVYDSIDSSNRTMIYDPVDKKFVILDGGRQIRTEVTTREIDQLIRVAEKSARDYMAETPDPSRVPMLQFQLTPDFVETTDDRNHVMKLNGTGAIYEVKCVDPESEEHVKAYLEYADWAAQLNYVVHKHAPLPGPRLALDESLRRHSWLPIEVLLQSKQKNGPRLRAEHVYVWKLDDHDRRLITSAESELAQPKLKQVDFDSFLQKTRDGQAQAKR